MSRGLGKLQRSIKELIEAKGARFDRESDEGEPSCSFWLTWTDIRFHLYGEVLDSGDEYRRWLSLERAAKRALYTLWKRGEIGRIRDWRTERWHYMTAETYNECFSPEAGEKLKASLEALEALP